ncbi:mitogen-activated protein kinase [Halteromyces radiatus]|uniref:mitogen-activated protein kinase n=1 Tax=Halteromyces radiatus TaxID=101107 RepID=UPI00221F143F|nr:mitogen-activated protein kinase [Halteromyces radiatus]KAI8085081.1 mitogen-activated protein kinase [Halteromyces radiatus]
MEQTFESECQRYFHDGLKAAFLTDKDGVIILKSLSDDAPPKATDPLISTNFAVANNQASKLGLKHNEIIVSMYGLYQIVQLDQNPLIITIISDASANTGIFMHLARQLKKVTDPLVHLMQTGGHLTATHQE